MDFSRYRIKPGTKVKLKQWNPDDDSAAPGSKEIGAEELARLNHELDELQDVLFAEHKHKILIVLQGMDTSGKDGVVRYVFNSVDPLGVQVTCFKAPTAEELDHDYLWRVHKHVPAKGEIAIFNRSHYEDVLIVRVHDWITQKECARRFRHINEFERMLTDTGTVVLKFFLYISKAEQKRRLEERLANPEKQWKFRLGDLDERKLWKQYMSAYEDALTQTSTRWAPWHVIPSNSKANRNLLVSAILIGTLEKLKLAYPASEENLSGVVVE
jgi:PPK2 family polyphosphate:nucleotide phosphotransferase